MKLDEEGKISFEMPSRTPGGNAQQIEMRRPRLEELFDLWAAIDRLAEQSPARTETDNGRTAAVVPTMKNNLQWVRQAVMTLGPEGLYAKNGDGHIDLVSQDVDEPGWFVNGMLGGQWLSHWQTIPLDLGVTT